MKHIVKRKGHREEFDPRKIYASVYSACAALRMSDKEAELIADTVSAEVEKKVKYMHEISTRVLHRQVVNILSEYSADAAYLYDSHRDIS